MATDWKDILGTILQENENNSEKIELSEEIVSESSTPKSATLFYERKGRGGKSVTILSDITGIEEYEIKDLASDIKKTLGTGGSARGGEILIQGDRRPELRKFLENRGFKVKG